MNDLNKDVELRELTRDNWIPIVKLQIRADEKGYVARNEVSIAEAYFEPDTFPLGIFYQNKPAGFLYYGQFAEDNGEWWIARLMVDQNFRRLGIAKSAVLQLFEILREKSVSELFLSVVPKNKGATNFYLELGFEDTGKMNGSERLYRIGL